jgi:hypothetical protein
MKIFTKILFIFVAFFILLNFYNLVNAKFKGKDNYELARDPDFVGAVKFVINDYYHKGSFVFANSIKAVIEQYCYVEKDKIKCK